MSVPSWEDDHVLSQREQVKEWRLPRGISFRDNGLADQTGTTEKDFYLILSWDNHDKSTKVSVTATSESVNFIEKLSLS